MLVNIRKFVGKYKINYSQHVHKSKKKPTELKLKSV